MNALSMVNLGSSLQITVVVVPVAVYFLILGLLNSRPRPQLLTGRLDFALLVLPLSPLLLLPVMQYLGSAAALLAGAAALAAVGVLLAPPRANWVIYNMPVEAGRRAVRRAFEQAAGQRARPAGGDLELAGRDARVEITSFPLLRNLSVRLRAGDRPLAWRFAAALADEVGCVRAETHPSAVALLLVATGMLVMPLTLIAPQAGEIVRLLTDLLP